MKRAILVLAAATAAVSTLAVAEKISPLTSPAPPSGAGLPTGQCIRSHDIRNHTIADRKTLLIAVDRKATYRVTMVGSCLAGAVSSDPIITRNPPGSDIICKPIDMDIGIAREGFESQCIVDSIIKMSSDEVAALPKKLRP